MTTAQVLLDAGAFRDSSPAALAAEVLRATLPAATTPPTGYYADRLAALGLNPEAAIAALAGAVPTARVLPGPATHAPSAFPVDPAVLRAALAASCDPARLGMLEQAIAAFAARCKGRAADPPVAPGCVAVTPADEAAARAYFDPPAPTGCRQGLRPPAEAHARVLAGRDRQLGLLLGHGMVFLGQEGAANTDTLPPGLVLFGPRATLPPAQYWLEAVLWLPPDARMVLDISSNRGLRRLAELTLRGPARLSLGFTTGPQDDAIEVRLVNPGESAINGRIRRLAICQ
jgi:hypothetical protein